MAYGMHEPVKEHIVTYRAGDREAEVQLIDHRQTPYRVVYRFQGRTLPPEYHSTEDNARRRAGNYASPIE